MEERTGFGDNRYVCGAHQLLLIRYQLEFDRKEHFFLVVDSDSRFYSVEYHSSITLQWMKTNTDAGIDSATAPMDGSRTSKGPLWPPTTSASVLQIQVQLEVQILIFMVISSIYLK